MQSSRQSAARTCLSIATVALTIAATLSLAGPQLASGAPRPKSGSQAKCVTQHRRPSNASRTRTKRLGRRSCKTGRSQTERTRITSEPSQPLPQIPATMPQIPTAAAGGDPNSTPDNSQVSNNTDGSPEPSSTSEAPLQPEVEAAFRFFSPTSLWNMALTSDAPLDSKSSDIVGTFDTEIELELQAQKGPGISTTSYGVPIYTVPQDQPTARVQLVSSSSAPALQSAWEQVPLPANAQPSGGTDRTLVVWQPSTDKLWEFWRLVHTASGWQASWGGAIQNVASDPGVYGPEAWPGAKPWWGSSASSLSIAGGLITLEDLQRGQINHALALAIPNVRAGVYASPAQRTDGKSSDPLSLPEGAHLRLDPNLDLAALHLPRLTLMIAEAAQRYGIIVRDGASVVHFFAQDPVSTGSNPYSGPKGYFEGKYPGELLASFPWGHLQLLKMELHKLSP